MCEFNEKLTNEELEQVAGGTAFAREIIVIRIQYSAMDSRNQIRQKLISELMSRGIPITHVPSAYILWKDGMTMGYTPGVIVYECYSDGEMIRCYKG